MIILNDNQQYIADMAYDFYRYSSGQIFQFAGGPGTGKSVVMKAIADRLVMDNILTYDEIGIYRSSSNCNENQGISEC